MRVSILLTAWDRAGDCFLPLNSNCHVVVVVVVSLSPPSVSLFSTAFLFPSPNKIMFSKLMRGFRIWAQERSLGVSYHSNPCPGSRKPSKPEMRPAGKHLPSLAVAWGPGVGEASARAWTGAHAQPPCRCWGWWGVNWVTGGNSEGGRNREQMGQKLAVKI